MAAEGDVEGDSASARKPRARKADPEKEALDRLKEAAFHPSLDEVWGKHPVRHQPGELPRLVEALRTERALWRGLEERRDRKARDKAAQSEQPAAAVGDDWDD